MRGEHPETLSVGDSTEGSSPHARGAHVEDANLVRFEGIIPACAGSTRMSRPPPTRRRDHPRMRGEHSVKITVKVQSQGSSPHARGAQHRLRVRDQLQGIIPACAGSTACSRLSRRGRWDHPRMRGEHALGGLVDSALEGSSPHARGAPRPAQPRHLEQGIIPACAGSTWRAPCARGGRRDHPRMRGEHSNLPASLSDVLKQLIHFPQQTRDHHAHRYRERNLCALRCLDALLHPVGSEPMSVASSVPTGRLMSFSPSQSTGTQSG